MKNLKFSLPAVIIIFAGICLLTLVGIFPENPVKPPEAPASVGTRDNPKARMEHEWRRLHDPATKTIPKDIRQKELAFAKQVEEETRGLRDRLYKSSQVMASGWTWRGPKNVGGRTRALAIDVSNENVIVAGGVSGGMWRSTDSGSTWEKKTVSSELHSVTCIVQDTRSGKTDTWYYGTGELHGNSASGGSSNAGSAAYRGDGIYKSTDGGVSWTLLDATSTNNPETFDNAFDYIYRVTVDPTSTGDGVLLAATYGGIYRSPDGGDTWGAVLGDVYTNAQSTEVAYTSTGKAYATLSSDGTTNGIYSSTNGTDWTDITPGDMPAEWDRIVLGIAPSNEDIVYFLAETPGAGSNDHSLWKYDASSDTWENRSANLPANEGNGDNGGTYDSQGSYNMVLKVKPDDEDIVIMGGVNLYRSTDGFATNTNYDWIGGWNYENSFNHHADQHEIVFLPSDPDKMYSGHDGGISRTENNTAATPVWSSLNNFYNTTQFYTIAIDPVNTGSKIVLGGMQDNGTWLAEYYNTSVDWEELYSGDGSYCVVANTDKYYVSSQYGTTYRMYQESHNWRFIRLDPASGTGYDFVNPFAVSNSDRALMYMAGGSELWRCADVEAIPFDDSYPKADDSYWDKYSNVDLSGETITALGLSNSEPNRLYFGSDNGSIYRIDGADSGDPVPVDIFTGKGFPTEAFVSCIAVDPNDDDKAVVVFSNYKIPSIFYTEDGGTSWTEAGGNLEETRVGVSTSGPSIRWITIHPLDNGTTVYYVGTSTGLYSTTELDGASTVWAPEAMDVIGNMVVDMVVSRPVDGIVAVGTHGHGIYYATVVSSVEDDKDNPVNPDSYRLHQNYPNPFNPETRISFSIPRTEHTTIKVFSVTGQEIITLMDDISGAGDHSVVWNGKNKHGISVPSGIYICRISAGDFSASRKMMLIK